jgi:hypothetical protein
VGVAVPYLILLAFQAYQHGYKQSKMPEPFYFVGASGAMAIAGIVAYFNPTVGALFAWALLTGAFVSGQAKSVPPNSEKLQGLIQHGSSSSSNDTSLAAASAAAAKARGVGSG